MRSPCIPCIQCIDTCSYVCEMFVLFRTYLFVRALLGKTPSSRHGKPDRTQWSSSPVHSGARGNPSKFFFSAGLDKTISRGLSTRPCLFSYVRTQADVLIRVFVFFARSTAHSPDTKAAAHRACLPPTAYGTTTLPPSSKSNGQYLARMADRTARWLVLYARRLVLLAGSLFLWS